MYGRARLEVFALAVLFLLSASVVPARAAESRAAATQDGWWNRLQGPQEGEPAGNPIRPIVPALPKPSSVPADAIATSVTAGQVDKVAAVGIDVLLAEGAALEGLVLRLKESPASGANVGAEGAKVIACPATNPWGSGQNANWQDRPDADCSLGSAPGTRADDGTWTFDLAAIGRLWADPYAPLPAYGVVLSVDPAASSSPVQVSWINFETGGVTVELAASPAIGAVADAGPVATGPSTAPVDTASGSALADTAGGGFPSAEENVTGFPAYSAGPGASATSPAASDTSTSGASPESPAEAGLGSPAAAPDHPAPVLQSRRAVDFWEHVPTPTALLIPVAFGLALLVSVTLGPAGRPSPVFRREGGLSRALARRKPRSADGA